MTVRAPVYMLAPLGETYKQVYPFSAQGVTEINDLAGYAFALNPNPRIEIGGTNGTLLANQPFVDTWWSAGASTTDVTNFDTATETPNVFKVTDNYSNIRIVYDSVTLPTGDTNNTQYPLYLYSPDGAEVNAGFRAMSVTDFIDTFVLPVLDSFGGGGQTFQKSGTYYMTTSAAPANATIIGTAALNQEANVAAYAASSIPETPTQNNNITTYSIAKVNYPATASVLWEGATAPLLYDLPMYFDYGTESIKQHTPATWAALLNPFLRFYLGGGSSAHTISYNIDGSDGVTNGTVFTDTAITTAGSTYNTRFVNADDYRTQEFPTGTATVQGASKAFKIHQGLNEAITLLGTSGSPQTFTSDGPEASSTTTRSPTTGQDYNSSTDYWQVVTGTPLSADDGSGTYSNGGRVIVRRGGVAIFTQTYAVESVATSLSEVTVIGVTYHKGTLEDGSGVYVDAFGIYDVETTYETRNGFKFTSTGNIERTTYPTFIGGTEVTHSITEWCNITPSSTRYIRFTDDTSATMGGSATRVTANTGDALNTWHSLAADREFRWASQEVDGSYGARFTQCKVEIASDAAGSNILATGYYNTAWNGAAGDSAQLEGTTAVPEVGRGSPIHAPSVNMGWRFNTNGTVEDYDSDNATVYSAAGHINWVDSTPSGTWYIRATVYQSQGTQTQASSAMNTWYALSSNRQFIFDDTRAFASYGVAFVTYKVEISRNNDGTNIAATGYYRWNYEGGA